MTIIIYLAVCICLSIGIALGRVSQWYNPDINRKIKETLFSFLLGMFAPITFIILIGRWIGDEL